MKHPLIRLSNKMKSTSFHTLNADKKLSKPHRLLWWCLNWINNKYFPNTITNHIKIRCFSPDVSESSWQQLPIKSSPSRTLGDLFWLQLPWGNIKSELQKINIFDTGCGSGEYSLKLKKFSHNQITSYTGADVSPRPTWGILTKKSRFFRLITINSAHILDVIPDETNLFITQSAIEHFDYDLVFFEQIRDFINRNKKPTIQIHLFPSSACLRLYRFHGVRQYTPRTISKIAKLFQEFSYVTLFRLGGSECNQLHYKFITKARRINNNSDMRETKTKEYYQLLRQAIEKDKISSSKSEPHFYALVIHSYWKNAIFL